MCNKDKWFQRELVRSSSPEAPAALPPIYDDPEWIPQISGFKQRPFGVLKKDIMFDSDLELDEDSDGVEVLIEDPPSPIESLPKKRKKSVNSAGSFEGRFHQLNHSDIEVRLKTENNFFDPTKFQLQFQSKVNSLLFSKVEVPEYCEPKHGVDKPIEKREKEIAINLTSSSSCGEEFEEFVLQKKRRLSISSSKLSIGASKKATQKKSRNEIHVEVSKAERYQKPKSRNEICLAVSKAETSCKPKSRNEICLSVSKSESIGKPNPRNGICIEVSKSHSFGKPNPRNEICVEVSKAESSQKPNPRNEICIGVSQYKICQVPNISWLGSSSVNLLRDLRKLGLGRLCWVWHRSSFFKCKLLSVNGDFSNSCKANEILLEAKIGSETKLAPLQDFQPSRNFLGLLGKLADVPFVAGEVVEIIRNSSDERKVLVIGDTTSDEFIGNDAEGNSFSIAQMAGMFPVRCCVCTPGGKWMFISPQRTTSHLTWPPVSLINGIDYEKRLQNP